MIDFSDLERYTAHAFQEVKRFIERAEYYKEQQDYTQALTNYANALQAYAAYARLLGKSDITVSQAGREAIYTKTLFDLALILIGVINCYSDSVEQAFFEAQLQKISNELIKYQKLFDAERLRNHDKIKDFVKTRKTHIEKNRVAIEELEKKPVKQLEDPFRLLKAALVNIGSTNACPISFGSLGCFIATAAYMTSTHPDLDTFRAFRDQRLLTNSVGRLLVHIYYRTSPALASYISSRQTLRDLTKRQLKRLAQWMRERKITD